MIRVLPRLAAACRRLRHDARGNVLMIFGLALVPITFATGMTVDYARAARTQTRLNAVVDAAALAGVTPTMLGKSRYDSLLAVYRNFYGQTGIAPCQTAAVNRVVFGACTYVNTDDGSVYTFSDGTLSVVITDTNANANGLSRTIQASYTADSLNIFGNVLGAASMGIGGTTTTNAKTAPDIDFYVLLDTSGSMAFPSTSAGITQLRSKTGGCAFACHSTNDGTARDANGNMNDYYGVAKSFNIPLRVDEAKTAVGNMMSLATTTSTNNKATYRAALMSFAEKDTRANNSFRTLKALTSNLSSVGTAANNASTSLYYNNGCPTQSYCNNDTDTASSDAFNRMNTLMPAPGNGTKANGDKPQQILFVVTDGMRDETRANGRPEVGFEASWCSAIKARGIRIAILYTEYLQSSMDGDGWSQSAVVPYLYQVEPALTDCASPGLMYKVTTDDDISAALNKLFMASITNAHITN